MGGEEQALAATEEACRVYVGNLLPKAKEIHLTSKFARFGTIHSVWIARRPPGFAFVRFANPDAAQRAVDTCREGGAMEILGKAVRVQMAGDKDRKSAEQQQAINSKHTAKEKDLNAVESGNHNRRSRSRSSRRGERSEDSRGGSHKRVRHRSSSERHRVSDNERHHRRSRSRSYCRERYEGRARSRSRSEFRRRSRSRSRRRDKDRCRSRSRGRQRLERVRRSRSRR